MAKKIEDEDKDISTNLIEFSKKRAEYIASNLKNVTVVNGDGLENEILEENYSNKNDQAITETKEEERNLSIDELAKKYKVVNPESLNNSLDLREFMKNKIPDRLKQLALRRLWKVVPIYGEVSELVEYGEDFTDAAKVVDGLQTAYVVGNGYAEKFIEKSEEVLDKQNTDSNKDLNNNQEFKTITENNDQNETKTESISYEEKSNKKNKIKQKSSEGQSLSINNQDANVRLEQKEILKEKTDQKSKIIRPQKMIFKK